MVEPKVQTNTSKFTKILLAFGQLSRDPEVTDRSQGWQMNGQCHSFKMRGKTSEFCGFSGRVRTQLFALRLEVVHRGHQPTSAASIAAEAVFPVVAHLGAGIFTYFNRVSCPQTPGPAGRPTPMPPSWPRGASEADTMLGRSRTKS